MASAHGHEIISSDLPQEKALAIEKDGKCYIGLDYHLQGMMEKFYLCHELWHCEYAGFYYAESPSYFRQKAERNAWIYAYTVLLPIQDVKEALEDGCCEYWDLADRFNVPIWFVKDALDYYNNIKAV